MQMHVELAEIQKINPEMKTQSQMEEDMQTVEAAASQSKEKILPETKTPSSQMEEDMQTVVAVASQSKEKILPGTMDAMGESEETKKINPKAQEWTVLHLQEKEKKNQMEIQQELVGAAVEEKKDYDVPGEADEDTSINKEEVDTKKSNKGRDLSKVPAIGLHYDALVPNGHIGSTHVHKIMGYKIKSGDEEKALIAQWQDWKKEVRVWAAFEIKQMMKEEALKIAQDDQFATPTINGHRVSKFLDIKKWWASAPADCLKSEANFFHLAYGMSEKFWERDMEEQFMKEFGWTYDKAEGQGPERMWLGRICDEGLCSEKYCTCEGRNSKGFAKKGVGKQTMENN